MNQLLTPDFAGIVRQGYEAGREMKRERVVEGALSAYAQNPNDAGVVNALMPADPALAMRLQGAQKDQQLTEARRAVFAPPQPAMAGAPQQLVDPSQLPPRTDGLQVNPEALRELYRLDPEAAMEIQKTVYSADAAAAKRFKDSGEIMASAAYRLSQIPPEQRAAELQALAPQLQGLGVDPRMLAQADLTNEGLQRYMTVGRTIGDLLKDDAAKWVSIPAGGTMVNVRDPNAVAQFQGGQGGQPRQLTSQQEY